MMLQQFQQPEPPNKVNKFMEKAGWPIITIAIGTALATIIGAVLLGKIQVLDFNWLMLLLVLVLVVITIFFMMYNLRTRSKLQRQYQADVAALRKEFRAFQDNFRDMINQEFNRLNEWAASYSQANAKEQAERLEEAKKEYLEAINDAKTSLTSGMANNQTLWQQWITSHANAHRWEQERYKQQLEALEEKLTDKQLSERDT